MRKRNLILMIAFLAATMLLPGCKGKVRQLPPSEKQGSVVKANVKPLTAQLFKEKIVDYEKSSDWNFKGEKPAIIDFYATWCGPCKRMAPVLDSIAGEYQQQIDVYKIDVDQEEELAQMFGISSIPSLLFIPKEGQPKMQVGALGRQELELRIKTDLLSSEKKEN